ncbi:Uncharacterized protein TCM_022890 [Theobroma cacao]|uniref:Uncharacterized protein n=1 Tax=Theobroma cacao TaxID=3641 RepID=A0A061EVJ8_THECC|nr:Uncharacterized protein TCM_022890 [Theobroma cacao]
MHGYEILLSPSLPPSPNVADTSVRSSFPDYGHVYINIANICAPYTNNVMYEIMTMAREPIRTPDDADNV